MKIICFLRCFFLVVLFLFLVCSMFGNIELFIIFVILFNGFIVIFNGLILVKNVWVFVEFIKENDFII